MVLERAGLSLCRRGRKPLTDCFSLMRIRAPIRVL